MGRTRLCTAATAPPEPNSHQPEPEGIGLPPPRAARCVVRTPVQGRVGQPGKIILRGSARLDEPRDERRDGAAATRFLGLDTDAISSRSFLLARAERYSFARESASRARPGRDVGERSPQRRGASSASFEIRRRNDPLLPPNLIASRVEHHRGGHDSNGAKRSSRFEGGRIGERDGKRQLQRRRRTLPRAARSSAVRERSPRR